MRAFVEPHHHGDGYAVVLTQPGSGLLLGLDHHPDADRACFEARRTGLDHLAFGVPSRAELEAWTARLDTLRVAHDPVTETTEPAPLALVTFRDPDEIALELIWYGG